MLNLSGRNIETLPESKEDHGIYASAKDLRDHLIFFSEKLLEGFQSHGNDVEEEAGNHVCMRCDLTQSMQILFFDEKELEKKERRERKGGLYEGSESFHISMAAGNPCLDSKDLSRPGKRTFLT